MRVLLIIENEIVERAGVFITPDCKLDCKNSARGQMWMQINNNCV